MFLGVCHRSRSGTCNRCFND